MLARIMAMASVAMINGVNMMVVPMRKAQVFQGIRLVNPHSVPEGNCARKLIVDLKDAKTHLRLGVQPMDISRLSFWVIVVYHM